MGHILHNLCRSGVICTETFTMCGTRNSFVIIKQNFDRRSKSGEGGEKKESGNIKKVNKFAYLGQPIWFCIGIFLLTRHQKRSLQQSVIV